MLFAVAGASFGWVAWRLVRSDDVDGWLAGAGLALGVSAGYLVSCTISLPGIPTEHWSTLGDTSTAAAAVLLGVSAARGRSGVGHLAC